MYVWQLKVNRPDSRAAHYVRVSLVEMATDDAVKGSAFATLAGKGYDMTGVTLTITRRP
jgi:hypothetical protein